VLTSDEAGLQASKVSSRAASEQSPAQVAEQAEVALSWKSRL